ncbi:24385_t:CDS:2, partial [Gigaspora margarita]
PNNIRALWNISFTAISEDFAKHGIPNGHPQINAHYKFLNNYDLPSLTLQDNFSNELPRLILNKLNIIISSKDLIKIELLNEQQKLIFDIVIKHIKENQPIVIFVDGPADMI